MTTGQRIKEVRKAAGMTQKELAGKLGLAYQTLAQWENDLRKPKIETLERISIVLRVPVKQILDEPSWLHENLRFYRDIDGVSRNKLSAETGIPVSIIKTYEDPCSSRFITEEYLQKIADYFYGPIFQQRGNTGKSQRKQNNSDPYHSFLQLRHHVLLCHHKRVDAFRHISCSPKSRNGNI